MFGAELQAASSGLPLRCEFAATTCKLLIDDLYESKYFKFWHVSVLLRLGKADLIAQFSAEAREKWLIVLSWWTKSRLRFSWRWSELSVILLFVLCRGFWCIALFDMCKTKKNKITREGFLSFFIFMAGGCVTPRCRSPVTVLRKPVSSIENRDLVNLPRATSEVWGHSL